MDSCTHPLNQAIARGDTGAVRRYLARHSGVPESATPPYQPPLLHHALITQGDKTAVLETLLEGGAPPEHANARGETPLHLACELGLPRAARILLHHPATPVEATDAEGATPLGVAARRGFPDLVSLVLDAGADPSGGAALATPVELALLGGHESIVRVLLDAGASPEAPADAPPLVMLAVDNHCLDALRALDAHGACLNTPPHSRGWRTALTIAAERGDMPCLRTLLALGADPNAPDRQGTTALLAAAFAGHIAAVEELLGAGADPRLADRFGLTVLHQPEILRAGARLLRRLLAAGADPHAPSLRGVTPVQRSRERGYHLATDVFGAWTRERALSAEPSMCASVPVAEPRAPSL